MDRFLFLYGECGEKIFGELFPLPLPPTEPYVLEGYTTDSIRGKAYLVPSPGARIAGFLCPVEDPLLWAMDQWKCVPLLRREEVEETGIFAYFLNGTQPYPSAQASNLEEDLAVFRRQYTGNELGRCDLHFMYPCSFEAIPEEWFENIPEDEITLRFIKHLEQVGREEFSGSYLLLEHRPLGIYPISVSLGEDETLPDTQMGFLYFSRHRLTQSGSINLVIPNTSVSALWLLDRFCGNTLHIQDEGRLQNFTDWLQERWGVTLFGTPRAVLFAYDHLDRYQILKCLAMEAEPIEKLIGPTLQEYAAYNIAQYDVAEVYASPKCLVEVERNCIPNLTERLNFECIEIYFVELLLLQTASVRRVCQKVLDYMNSDEVLSGEKNYNQLLALSNEMSTAILFFDYNHFLYPTVSLACQKISKRFGMEAELEKYKEYRTILEQMIDLANEERNKIENDSMNLLLLILTLVQVLPTLIETFHMTLTGAWTPSIILSWGLSIGTCLVLCGAFSLYKRYQVSRAKRLRRRRNGVS